MIAVWDVPTRALLKSINTGCNAIGPFFTWQPRSNYIASGFGDNIGIWDVVSGQLINTVMFSDEHDSVYYLAWSSNGSKLINIGNHLKIWNFKTTSLLVNIDLQQTLISAHTSALQDRIAILGYNAQSGTQIQIVNLDAGSIQKIYKISSTTAPHDFAWNATRDVIKFREFNFTDNSIKLNTIDEPS